jgi:CubicO group peptidase (beta-lactamase class C family)
MRGPTTATASSRRQPFVASCAWTLIAEGTLRVGDRVVEYFPEFGANGKERITVEQVMLHTAGFPHAPMGPPEWYDRAARVQRMSSWTLNWAPGTRYEYHPTSAHWVLAGDRSNPGRMPATLAERITAGGLGGS